MNPGAKENMLSATEIVDLHDRRTEEWHRAAALAPDSLAAEQGAPWLAAVERQHRANYELWHIEDEARAPGATDPEIAAVKRRIDRTNQRRNDLAEELDRMLLAWLEERELPRPTAPLHSSSRPDAKQFSSVDSAFPTQLSDPRFRLTSLRQSLIGGVDPIYHQRLHSPSPVQTFPSRPLFGNPIRARE